MIVVITYISLSLLRINLIVCFFFCFFLFLFLILFLIGAAAHVSSRDLTRVMRARVTCSHVVPYLIYVVFYYIPTNHPLGNSLKHDDNLTELFRFLLLFFGFSFANSLLLVQISAPLFIVDVVSLNFLLLFLMLCTATTTTYSLILLRVHSLVDFVVVVGSLLLVFIESSSVLTHQTLSCKDILMINTLQFGNQSYPS